MAGYRCWQSLGRQVRKGERGIAILAPCVYRARSLNDTDAEDAPGRARILKGFRAAHVWDVSQTDGEPVPDVRPELLSGYGPSGLWGALAAQLASAGFELHRKPCGQANGITDYGARTVTVRPDVDGAQAAKTLAHDLLTALPDQTSTLAAPSPGSIARGDPVVSSDKPEVRMDPRDLSTLTVARAGGLETISSVVGVRLMDGDGVEVLPVTEFLMSLRAGGVSTSSERSYASALLRWWRFLSAVEIDWDRASRVECRDFVLWMRTMSKRPPHGGPPRSAFAPATIDHNLAVLRSFYDDRMAAGVGPIVNPVPQAAGRHGGRRDEHHNPMQPFEHRRRAPLRQRKPPTRPKGLADHLFNELFAAMGCDRDRALLAFYVSTGARASELLEVSVDHVDVGRQLIAVNRKGDRRLQWLPASADAFVWLRLYEAHQTRPEGQAALWLTRRAPHRPLTYSAMRRALQRANARLGTAWTLHQIRHTAAQRMVADRRLPLTDVQWVLGHAHLTTTELYTRPSEDEVVARVLEHHRHRSEPAPIPPVGAYRPAVLQALLGGAACAD